MPSFISQRLELLHEIDCKIVSLLDNMSTIFQTYGTRPSGSDQEKKDQMVDQTKNIYSILSTIAIDLRKEVKIMNDNIGVYDKNEDDVMILPVSVTQKNTKLGEKKLMQELAELDKLDLVVNESGEAKTGDVKEEVIGAGDVKADMSDKMEEDGQAPESTDMEV